MKKQIAYAYYQLGSMLDAGLPIVRAIQIIAGGLKGKMQKIFTSIEKDISLGNSIVEAMSKYPRVFGKLDLTLIKAAELSGNLPQSLMLLSKWYEFRRRIQRNMLSGLVLPILYIHIIAFVPQLPFMLLGKITPQQYITFVVTILAIVYVPAAIIFFIMKLTHNIKILHSVLDRLVFIIPILGKAVFHLSLSRYCRAFHMLYKAGVPATESSEISTEFTGNMYVSKLFEGGAQSAKVGNPVSEGLSEKLPQDFRNLWLMGEESGQLDKATERLADMNAESAEFLLTEFSKWLPRLVYFLIIGVMVYLILQMLGTVISLYDVEKYR